MQPWLILLNGPPRSGKDTLAARLKGWGAVDMKMSRPLKDGWAGLMGWGDQERERAEHTKDRAFSAGLPGSPLSYRQAQIDLSERFLKPLYGPDVFGRIAAWHLEALLAGRAPPLVTVSDSGFAAEIEPLLSMIPPQRTVLFRLNRPGCDFKGDSRSYLDLTHLGVHQIDLMNCHSIDDLERNAVEALRAVMGLVSGAPRAWRIDLSPQECGAICERLDCRERGCIGSPSDRVQGFDGEQVSEWPERAEVDFGRRPAVDSKPTSRYPDDLINAE